MPAMSFETGETNPIAYQIARGDGGMTFEMAGTTQFHPSEQRLFGRKAPHLSSPSSTIHLRGHVGRFLGKAEKRMDFQPLLKFAVDHQASDIHVQADLPPLLRIGGILRQINQPAIKDEEIRAFIASIAPVRFRDSIADRLISG